MITGSRRLRLGMVGGGEGAFIGAVHRLAARMDDRYALVAGALSSDPRRAQDSGLALGLAPDRTYASYRTMAEVEATRDDGIDVVAIVTPNHLHHAVACAFIDAGIHVICDKPMTTSVDDGLDLLERVRASGLAFGLTHNYTGYPMVRHARELVANGELGTIRLVQVEYAQDWLTTALEQTGQKQAAWRTDPARSGPGGCLGDIGTHAFNLASFVTGLELVSVSADVSTFVEGRAVDDNCQVMLRYAGGAKGALWASQVAPGNENDLQIRIYGDRGGLHWRQETPNALTVARHGHATHTITRGGHGAGPLAAAASRIPAGHPEGYLEAFAVLYRDFADAVLGRDPGDPIDLGLVPTVMDGVLGVAFVDAALRSSRNDGAWVDAGIDAMRPPAPLPRRSPREGTSS